jgi:protoporphyrinogen/coproporphyrinogen III oxidase
MLFDSVIIGAGISGLTAAYYLKQAGQRVLLLELSDRVGGAIQSFEAEGFLLERGPNSLRGTHEFLDLVDELHLQDELITADPKAPAYVYFNQSLHPVPMSPLALIQSKLLSTSAKVRLLREPFIAARRETSEESLASFVRRRLGDEVLERLVAPFVCGRS